MTESTPLAKAAAELLTSDALVARDPSPDTARLEVEVLRRELARTRRKTSLRNKALAFAAAAALVLGAIAVRRSMVRETPALAAAPTTRVQSAHGRVSIERGAAVVNGPNAQPGDVVTCKGAECRADLVLPSGSVAGIRGDTRIALSSTSDVQLLRLDTGSARFDVVKLRPGERFIVKTADAEIEVRGTSFQITVGEGACREAGRTQVEVFEGVVAVRHGSGDLVVTAGQRWPTAPCPAPPAPSAAPAISVSVAPSTVAPPSKPAATSSSELSAHNALWADAVAAKKRGDNPAALAGFTKYLAKYPHGFLAEAAEVERMRLLSGPARVEAARAYLAKHPNGYARAEALAIVERGAQ